MKPVVIGFGLLIFALLVLFQLARISPFKSLPSAEIWLVIFCILFFCIGIFISRKFFNRSGSLNSRVNGMNISDSPLLSPDEQLQKLGISRREFEVLQLINEGLSNHQIAEKLFLSEHTVKKHVSNLFFKLEAARRTDALKKAKELRLIA